RAGLRISRRQAVKAGLAALAGSAASGALAPLTGGIFMDATAPPAWAAGPAAAPLFHSSPALPIPLQFPPFVSVPVAAFNGAAAAASPIAAPPIPRHPFMAPNGKSNTHDDAYMSDTYTTGGPLGRAPHVLPSFLAGLCVTMAFDRAGRIVSACLGRDSARLFLLDPDTLAPLAYLELPTRKVDHGEFPAGSYFYLDQQDRVVLPTVDQTLWVIAETIGGGRASFGRTRVYDVSGVMAADDEIQSALPDFSGRLWFVTRGSSGTPALVGTLNPSSGKVLGTVKLAGERIDNSFAVDETGGVFVVSDHALYRFDTGAQGAPTLTWRETYDRGNRIKPGQVAQGSGTTPTLMGDDYVTIADNADPFMHVLVYRRAKVGGQQLVDQQEVFSANKGCTENSLIATGRSIIVENNYGYRDPTATMGGTTTEPGMTRLDLGAGGLHKVWTNTEVVIPSLISKMSLANGLVYCYTHTPFDDPQVGVVDAWYLTAVDFESGEIVIKRLAGTGVAFNNHYAALYVGPDGTAYVGVLGGVVAIRDTK